MFDARKKRQCHFCVEVFLQSYFVQSLTQGKSWIVCSSREGLFGGYCAGLAKSKELWCWVSKCSIELLLFFFVVVFIVLFTVLFSLLPFHAWYSGGSTGSNWAGLVEALILVLGFLFARLQYLEKIKAFIKCNSLTIFEMHCQCTIITICKFYFLNGKIKVLPGMSTLAFRRQTSCHPHCQTLHSNWELKIAWPTVFLQRTRSHPPRPWRD